MLINVEVKADEIIKHVETCQISPVKLVSLTYLDIYDAEMVVKLAVSSNTA